MSRRAVLDVLSRTTRQGANPDDRKCAVHALGFVEGPFAIDAIVEAIRDDRDPAVRAAAVVALGNHASLRAEQILIDITSADVMSPTLCRLALHELEAQRSSR